MPTSLFPSLSLVARAVTSLAFATCAVASIASCSAAPSDDSETRETSATTEALTSASTCPASTTYGVIRFVAPGDDVVCPSVAGKHGKWISSTEYPAQACYPTRDLGRGVPVFCTYVWTPSSRHPHAAPDEGALASLPNVYEAPFGNGGETTCAGPSALPHAALLDHAGVVCPPRSSHHPDGPAACTVCGVSLFPGITSGALFVPTTSNLHTIALAFSNGTQRIVTFDTGVRTAMQNRSRYVEVPLPSLPSGLHYVNGPAAGYGYGHQHP